MFMGSFVDDQNHPFSVLNAEIAKLKETLLSRVAEFQSALNEAIMMSAAEAERTERVQEELSARVTSLESQLREREQSLQAKNSLLREFEENLSAEIHDLKDQLRDKREAVESRERQVKDLNSKIELLTSVISRLEALAKQAEARVASEAEGAEQAERARENLRTEVNALQAQLSEKEQHLQVSDSSIKQLQESLAARVHDLESQLRDKEGLLESREVQVRNVRSEMDRLAQRTAQMEAATKQAEARVASEAERAEQAEQARENLRTEVNALRSEERRVGKECRSRWSPYH